MLKNQLMFSKTIRYTALILVLVLLTAWILSLFYKKYDSKEIQKMLKASADSIEYAKVNIGFAQHRIDSLLLKIDSVNEIVTGINNKVNSGNTSYQILLQSNIDQLKIMKEKINNEQLELDKLKEQLKLLK